ncbi:DUF932 domain-containing protein [Saccharothrix saharensis]|uniref:DUF932 domain-containing protein n=1 Tax=Saccharothrix saharensis TaxID=571190 RepID=UPI0011503A77|nr:DUF932 domain-containing protein [Saccharothrix saharensis]
METPQEPVKPAPAKAPAKPAPAKAEGKAPAKTTKAPAKAAPEGEAKPAKAKAPAKVEEPAPVRPDRDAWTVLATANNSSRTVTELLKKAKVSGWNVTRQPMAALVPSGKCTECDQPVGKKHTAGCLMLAELPSEKGLVEADHTTVPVEAPGVWSLVRTDPEAEFGFRHLGTTTREANPVPVEIRAAILSEIQKSVPGAKTGPAGPLWDETAAFATVRVPELVSVGKVDKVEMRAVLVNSLVGKSVVRVMPVHTGTNTVLPVTLPKLPDRVELTPDNDQDARTTEASEALDLFHRFTEEFSQVANRLLRKKMTAKEFETFADTVLKDKPMPSGGAAPYRAYEVRTGAVGALFRGEVDLTEKVKNTRWAALLAVTCWAQNLKPAKVAGDRGLQDRAYSAVFPARESLNTAQTALNLLLEGA